MQLPGTENWDRDEVRRRIEFLANASRMIPPLIAEIAKHARFAEPELVASRPNDALFAIADAAALAFVIGDVKWGLALCRDAATPLVKREQRYTPMQVLLGATLGAIAERLKLFWDGTSAAAILEGEQIVAIIPFEFPSSAYCVALMQRAASAQAASAFNFSLPDDPFIQRPASSRGGREETVRNPHTRRLWKAFLATPEGTLATEQITPSYERLAELVAGREQAFERRRQFFAGAAETGPRVGGLIDWGLLAVWIGFFRDQGSRPEVLRAETEAGTFIRQLAAAIADISSPSADPGAARAGAPG